MLIRTVASILLICSINNHLWAQLSLPQGREGSVRPFNEYVLSDWVLKHKDKYKDIDGSPFLNQQWTKGEIQTIKDERFQNVSLKLNLFEGQLMHKNNFTGDSSVVQESLLWAFTIPVNDSVYQFERFDAKPPLKNQPLRDFFIVMVRDKYSLLAKPTVNLQRATDNSLVNSVEKQKDRFVYRTAYFVKSPQNELIRLKNQKKTLQRIFGDQYKSCREFIDQKGFDWNKPQHLAELMTYYNNLQ